MRRNRRIFLCVFVAGILFRLLICSHSFDVLIEKLLADDAFYYLSIARNAASGWVISFDGLSQTNGFHPVLLILEVFLFKLLPESQQSGILPVIVVLLIILLTDSITAWFLYRICASMKMEIAGIFAVFLWFFHSDVWSISFTGVECSLVALFITLSLHRFIVLQNVHRLKDYLLLGLFLSFVMLSRTDSFVFAASIFIMLTINACWRKKEAHLLAKLSLLSGPPMLLLGTWFLWNISVFGRVSQDSGRTLFYIYHQLMNPSGTNEYLLLSLEKLQDIVTFYCGFWGNGYIGCVIWLVIIGLAYRKIKASHDSFKVSFIPQIFHFLFIVSFYACIFWHIQKWYLFSPLPLLVLLSSIALEEILRRLIEMKQPIFRAFSIFSLGTILMVFLAHQNLSQWQRGNYPWQRVCLGVADFFEGPGFSDGRVGALNAGLLGYLLPNRVVNLDGVVNPEILPVLKKKTWATYVSTKKITFIADFEDVIKVYFQFSDPEKMRKWRLVRRWNSDLAPGSFVILYTESEED